MPNILDADGLQLASQAELVAQFTAAFQAIYGADINLDQDSPDGQMMMIFIQAVLDDEDLLMEIYNGFDPDNAIGGVLDQRVAINGIQRQAGTFTVTPVDVTVSQSVNLYGLDQGIQPVYTIQDNAGNQWQLQTTQLGVAPGTSTFNFQAALPGAVQTVPNTITSFVSVVLGVTSVNNPSPALTVGINEETDAALRIRRQKSVSIGSQGYLAGLRAALLNINGVTDAFVYENNTSITDGDGTPGHTIWVVVAGSGAAADIANAIYVKRNAGAGMRGATSFVVTQVDGSFFTVRWDDVTGVPLFISFHTASLDGIHAPNNAAIIAGLPAIFKPGVFQQVNINELATLIQEIDPNTLVTFPTNTGFSTDNVTFFADLQPAKNEQFTVSSGNITIV